jgi:hypothetical protein
MLCPPPFFNAKTIFYVVKMFFVDKMSMAGGDCTPNLGNIFTQAMPMSLEKQMGTLF